MMPAFAVQPLKSLQLAKQEALQTDIATAGSSSRSRVDITTEGEQAAWQAKAVPVSKTSCSAPPLGCVMNLA